MPPIVFAMIVIFSATGAFSFFISRWIYRVQMRNGNKNAMLVSIILFIGLFGFINGALIVIMYVRSKLYA